LDVIKPTTAGFSILIQNTEPLRLSDIASIAGDADKIVFDNSILEMNSILSLPEIELVGKITIIMDNPDDFDGQTLFTNVSGDGVINIHGVNLDPMYKALAISDEIENKVYLQIVRETDYGKILDVKTGNLINELRLRNPNNPTLAAIDNAQDMSSLKDVMRRSVMFNPINLMRPVRVFNHLEANSYLSPSGMNAIEVMGIISDDFDMYAAKAGIGFNLDKLAVRLSAYAGQFQNMDDINYFSGFIYGANLRVGLDDRDFLLNSVFGVTKADFETDIIFDGSDIVYNPGGTSMYGAIDLGLKFDYISPFIGFGFENEKVLHQSDSSVTAKAGIVSGFDTTRAGIKYDYQFFAVLRTDDVRIMGLRMNVLSIADNAGGSISYAAHIDEIGVSHKLSLELTFGF
jgi:hypothetical protein